MRTALVRGAVPGAMLAAVLALAGCSATVEDRVERGLVDAGVPKPMATCMAGRMASRLSVLQLRKLARLKPREGEADGPLTISEYLERVRRVDDPEVLEVAATSAAVCAFQAGI